MPNHIKDSRGSLLRWWCARIPKNSHSKSCVLPSQPAVRIMKTVPPLKKIVDRQNNQRKMIVHCSLFSSFFLHLLGSNTAGGSKQWSHWCHQQRHSGLQLVWFWMGDHYKDLCFYRVLHGFSDRVHGWGWLLPALEKIVFLFDQWLKMWQLPVGFKTVIWLQAIEMS